MKNLLASAAMFFAAIILALSPISSSGQTSVTISNAVQQADIPRFGFNMGGDAPYGQGQILKSFNPYGYMQSAYWQTSWPCNAGGTVDTTHWYNSATDTGGYPANFFVGATYIAVSAMNGTSYGTGTITASTANTGSTGIDFTLGTPLSAACSTAQQDMLIVKFTKAPTGLISPQSFGIDACSGATWNTSDTSPASSNTTQSLQLPTACNVQFGSDESVQNLTNTNSSLAPQGVGWINLNGTYTFTFKAKCPVSACSLAYTVGRQGGTTYLNSSVTPTVNVTPKAGWNTYSFTFSAAETGAVTEGTLQYQLSSTGTVLVQDMDVIEGSTLPGNTTAYRDSVVRKLQALKPGSLRFMDGGDWCSDVSDMLTAGVSPVSGAAWQVQGNNRACGMNTYVPAALQVPLGYTDKLQLCVLVDADCWLTIGQFNLPSDWTTLINWLSSQGWISTFAASGHKIYLEEGNEAWNSGATGGLWAGGGTTYGYFLGPNMAAAKAANGYNSSVIKLVGDNGLAGGVGPDSWESNVLTVAQRTPNGLPDVMDQAAYTLDDLTSFNTSGSNVATTGAPFLDEWAEISNLNTHTLPSNPSTSVYNNCLFGETTFGVSCAIYEANNGTGGGSAISQLQLDQVAASVGEALYTAENFLLMQRDGGVTGPINTFQLAQNDFGYNCFFGSGCISGVVVPIWGLERYIACGPGQLDTCTDVDRPISIALQVVNNAIGSNNNLMSVTQSGTPTFSYAGGQPWGGAGTNSIAPNAEVPYVNCFSYSNGSGNWTTICFNNNLTTAETVTLAGAGAPTGSVTETTFPGPSNLITDHNENTFLGASSIAPVVAIPKPTITSGTTYTIAPASFIALTYSSTGGSTPTADTPTFSVAAGTYASAQTVAISDATAGTTIYYTTNGTTPTTASSVYSSPIAVSASETLEAIAAETGYTESSVADAAYVITQALPAPTFSLAAGTYASAQTVGISDATAGTTIYYTTNGTTPTTASAVYSGSITVSASETLEAVAVETGYTNSQVATAAYTINIVVPAPTFSPAGGAYTTAQSVSISDTTAGTTIYYTTNGTTPTTASSVYSAPMMVSSTKTIQAIAVETGDSNAVGTATYTITLVLPAPAFSVAPGTYATAQTVSISDATAGTTIYYTTNGTTPTTASSVYSGSITVSATETLEAIAVETGSTNSSVATAAYTIATVLPTPTFSVAAGTYTTAQTVSISDATAGTTIYYTTNGTTPTTASTKYAGTITVSASETLEAIAVETGSTNSSVATAAYTIATVLPTPTFSVAAGTYTTAQTVAISDATAGTTIYYTTNATTPTTASTKYAGTITVSASETLEAIAVETGYTNSSAATAAYTITPVLPTPTFSVAAGTYTTAQTVAISDATAGTTIYYTTNATTPTTASTKYAGTITVSASETLEAIAVETGYANSSAATAAYTINLVPASFKLSSSPSALSVTPGASSTDTISVADAGGFTGSVTLAASGLPSGVTAAFSANPTTGTSVLTLTASGTATAGTSTVTITGTSGTLTATTTIALTVTGGCAQTAITPYLEVNGAAWQQASTASVPTGANVNLGPQAGSGTWSWTGPNGFTSTARQIYAPVSNPGANVYVASYTNAAACTSTQAFTLTVPAGSFALSSSAPAVSIAPSASGTDTVSVTDTGGFTGSVTLAVSGLPSGVTGVLAPNPATGTSVLTFTASSTATPGTSTITVTGTSGTLTATTTIALTVSGACVQTAITPYLEVNGAWQQTSTASVAAGADVNFGPQAGTGTWSWTGPGGFTSTARQIYASVLNPGANTYVVTFTNAAACASTQTFVVTAGS